jgi:hypothetical protein
MATVAGWTRRRSVPTSSDLPSSYYYKPSTATITMSRLTRNLIAAVSPDQVIARRRENYSRLADAIAGVSAVRLLLGNTLPAGVCPIGLPVLVDERDHWLGGMQARGIGAIPWWAGFHRGLNWSRFPDAQRLKERVLMLPVHQDLDAAHIDYIVRAIVELAQAQPAPASVAQCA